MMIRVPNAAGSDMAAYLATPKAAKGAGVVVIQEIFGVNESMRKVCDFLASRQFTVICPDLYWSAERDVALAETEFEKARALRGKMNDEKVTDDIAAAVAFLRKHPNCTGAVGVVGYCWGGLLAYMTAARHKPDAAVAYYGVGIEKRLDLAGSLACPLMLHYGVQDQFAPPEVVAQVRAALQDKRDVTIHEYPDGGHAFARPGGSHYHHKSADLADMRTLSFLVEALIGKGKHGAM